MRLRSFTATTMADALRLVREELGEDAVIVNSEAQPSGGVRVSAAAESRPLQAALSPEVSQASTRVADPLREALDPYQTVADVLQSHGLSSRAQDVVMIEVEAQPPGRVVDLLTAGLKNVLRFDLRPPLPTPDTPLLLIGPQGAGKTTLAAKILTSLRLANEPIAAMTTDIIRAGGIDQLSAFTNLLACPLLEVEDAFAIGQGIAQSRDSKCLVIDTAGANPYTSEDMQANAEWICAASQARPILVLPAGLDMRETCWITHTFAKAGAEAILMTRADACRRLGGFVTAAVETGLQICGMAMSASVTSPPRPLTPRTLANLLIARSDVELAEEKSVTLFMETAAPELAQKANPEPELTPKASPELELIPKATPKPDFSALSLALATEPHSASQQHTATDNKGAGS